MWRRGPDDEGLQRAVGRVQGFGLGQEGPQGDPESSQELDRNEAGDGRFRVVIERWLRVIVVVFIQERLERVDVELGGWRLMPAASDWISLAEAAEILAETNVRFQPSTIGAWARSGKLQSIKLGGRRFVRRGEVKALVSPRRRVRVDDLQAGLFEDLPG